MIYVAHDCRNTKLPENHPNHCNNRWVDADLTGAKTRPPTWKYCRECCEKMGIDFDNQKPSDTQSEKRKAHYKKISELNKSKRQG